MSSLISFFCLFVCFKTLSYYNTHFPWSHIWKSITFFISDLWKTLNKTNKPTFLFFHTFHFGIYQSLILDYVFLSVLARENFFSKSDKELFAALLQSQPQTNKKTPTFRSSFTLLRTYFTNFTSGIKGEVAIKQTLAKEKCTKQQLLLIWTTYSGHF